MVDAAPSVARLHRFESEGFSLDPIFRMVGWPTGRRIETYRRIHLRYERRILALTRARLLAGLPDGARVPAVGAVRRVNALRAIGWPIRQITPGSSAARNVYSAPTMYARTHRLIAARFEALCMTPGPSASAIARSSHITPLMWDDIDDPDERPSRGTTRSRSAVDADDIERLLGSGLTVDGIADLLGVQYESLYKQLHRAGRDDLKDRLVFARRSA